MKGFKISFLLIAILSAFTIILTGCGGGGGGGGGGGKSAVTVSGLASKGPISGGAVTVFALDSNGTKGNKLGTTTTNADGSYSVNLGSYTGNVLVEVTGGTYTDEATGSTLTNTTTLRAAISGISGNVSVAVTPLTEIAVQLIGPTTLSIDQANSLVSIMAGGVNIINTMPANVMNSTACSTATVDQIKYGLMLATISQMIKDDKADNVSDAICKIKDDLEDNKQLDTVGENLSNALTNFIINTHNQSGVTTADTLATNLNDAINYITNNTITYVIG